MLEDGEHKRPYMLPIVGASEAKQFNFSSKNQLQNEKGVKKKIPDK